MKRKTKKRIVWISVLTVSVIIIVLVIFGSRDKGDDDTRTVKVERKDIIDKALAVGSIEPLNEIAVKSKIPSRNHTSLHFIGGCIVDIPWRPFRLSGLSWWQLLGILAEFLHGGTGLSFELKFFY